MIMLYMVDLIGSFLPLFRSYLIYVFALVLLISLVKFVRYVIYV